MAVDGHYHTDFPGRGHRFGTNEDNLRKTVKSASCKRDNFRASHRAGAGWCRVDAATISARPERAPFRCHGRTA